MLAKLRGVFKEFGAVAGLLYLADRALRALSPGLGLYVYELMAQPITDKPLVSLNLVKKVRFAEIGPGHADLALMPAPPAVIQARFEQQAVCVGAYKGDVLMGYIWLCFGRYEEDEVRCDYELLDSAQSVFDFDLYVLPAYRMGLGFISVWHGASLYLRSRGVSVSFSRLTRFNTASRRSHAHLGWQRVGRVLCISLWRVQLLLADMAPYVAFSASPRQRALLRLRPPVLAKDTL